VVGLANGGWVVTWTAGKSKGSIFQRQYDSNGAEVGQEARVNIDTTGYDSKSSVTALAGGGWVVTWESNVHDIYQQQYDRGRAVVGSETRLGAGSNAPATALADGGWVVTYNGSDGSGSGVIQLRYMVGGDAVEGAGYVLNDLALAELHGNTQMNGYHGLVGAVDSLHITGTGVELNLSTVAAKSATDPGGVHRVTSVEHIDLTGSGENTLKLSVNDVLQVSDTDCFTAAMGWAGNTASTGTHQMLIDGNAGDAVVSSGWTNSG
jgi:hypothetical protein